MKSSIRFFYFVACIILMWVVSYISYFRYGVTLMETDTFLIFSILIYILHYLMNIEELLSRAK